MGKEDGERVFIVARRRNESIRIVNMHNSVYTESILPKSLVTDIRSALPPCSVFVGDGEFISLKGDLYDFLSARAHLDDRLALRLWHVLSISLLIISNDTGVDLNTPLLEVKKYLEENVKQNERVSLVPYTLLNSKQEILDFFEKTIQTHEGIVIKPNLGYNAKWLKMRSSNTKDVVIIGVKKTEEWMTNNVPATFLIGGYDHKDHIYKRIGDVSSGLTFDEKAAIGRVLSKKVLTEDRQYLYVQPAIVLEIEYHKQMENGLRFPKIKRIRFDKRPEDCPSF